MGFSSAERQSVRAMPIAGSSTSREEVIVEIDRNTLVLVGGRAKK